MTASQTAPIVLSRKDRVYNFASCLIDATGWPLGTAFFSVTTILPVLLRRLGAGDLTIGCLPALANLLCFLPGFLVVDILNRRRRVRGYLIWVALAERIVLLPLAPLTALWALSHPGWLIDAVFACIGANGILMGLNQPAYWVAVGKSVPSHWRGRLFGYAGGLSGLLSLGVDAAMRHLLGGRNGGLPMGYSLCFWIGFTILIFTVLPLGALHEPRIEPHPTTEGGVPDLVRRMAGIWRANASFRRFLCSSIACQLATLAGPFYILYAAKHIGAGASEIAGFTATTVFVGAVGGLAWGAWGDRHGYKPVLLLSTLLAALAPIGALFAATPAAFYAVFAAMALSASGTGLAGFNIVMDFAEHPREIPLYSSTANAVTAIPRAVAPFVGGLIAVGTGGLYRECFVISAICAVVGLALTMRVADPRVRPDRNAPEHART
ncbi:MAG: MFS transporter [Capsulimonadaceae bacterium]